MVVIGISFVPSVIPSFMIGGHIAPPEARADSRLCGIQDPDPRYSVIAKKPLNYYGDFSYVVSMKLWHIRLPNQIIAFLNIAPQSYLVVCLDFYIALYSLRPNYSICD